MRAVIISVLSVLAAGCATSAGYAPALEANGPGYSHMQIESDRFSVTYRADGRADARLVEDYALLRAAELTLERGADWFIVDRRSTDEARTDTGSRFGVSVGGGNYGRSSGVGVGVGMSFPLGGQGAKASASTLDIRIGQGERPDAANAYDARAVAISLRANLSNTR